MFAPIAHFRQQLEQGHSLIGATVTLTDPRASDALADSVDFLWYDLEHTPLSHDALAAHLAIARGRQTPTLVRLPAGDTAHIKAVLDAGADGFIVPQVRSLEEVEAAVADCRYPPLGRRGFGPLIPTNYGRLDANQYVAAANRYIFASVMIETVEALEAIEAIVAVEGLDSVVLGPWDLSASLGLLGQVDHPRVVEAMDHICAVAARAGLAVGSGMPVDVEFAVKQIERGVQWCQVGVDLGYLIDGVEQAKAQIRAAQKNR